MIAGYIVFSVLSEWRIKFVRRMNDADTGASQGDRQLLNYETSISATGARDASLDRPPPLL